MVKVAVVGNREGWFRKQIYDILDTYNLTSEDFIITGGAKGVDTFAMDYAKQKGINLIVFYPSKSIDIPYRYYKRNHKIALECDYMLAFNKKINTGTQNSISSMNSLHKQVRVIEG